MTASGADDTAEILVSHGPAQDRPAPSSSSAGVDLGGMSHQGKVRVNNEDHFLIARFGRFLEALQSNLPPDAVPARSEEGGYGLVVADGMGGSAAGEEASRRAITGLVNLVLHTPDWIMRLDDEPLPQDVMRRAAERFEQINQSLTDQAREDASLTGFGTTMTLACSLGAELFITHLGDSRAYLLRKGLLTQITRDHTRVQDLVDQRAISRKEAATHRLRHVLTKCLGDHSLQARPDVTRVALEDGDRLLLCTDGLTEMVADDAIATILGGGGAAQTTCERLVDRALEAGGKDNVTVVVACYRLP